MAEDSGNHVPEDIDLDVLLYKLRDIFNFTAGVVFDDTKSLIAQLDAARASAQIATAISNLLHMEMVGFMMDFDDPGFGDPTLDPSSWPGSPGPRPTDPKPADGDDHISPDELDIE